MNGSTLFQNSKIFSFLSTAFKEDSQKQFKKDKRINVCNKLQFANAMLEIEN